ncbi:type IX secretion system membrane protein, PorP/SprF family [Maribacter dokdonensis]|uniref:Type IX secretion system membrane protein, PorP/SprF family n=3 Tax=Maribacter dokdonensis TaxID=320912 RepID=A0A1H4L1W3_9FLAO|nr:type IX secretion system membrane protein PorP/SprF [Maribacter dokdonensis]SEB64368.1 type IX secretion system membrane protein, PorP/SprF family [Maribacter dokdonensis]
MLKKSVLYLLLFVFAIMKVSGQEESPFVSYDVPAQNLLKYNRFLINPTFSTVREDKSYINLLHRNQSVQFDDNNQNYFLSYSGRISDRTGLGLSLYSQREGILSNFGVLANYAYGVKLNDKSNFTFGANVSYYQSGFDNGRASTVEEDPFLAGLQDQSLLSFQPGFNLSYGKFDVGMFAENLFDYNLKNSESVTEFKDKTYSAHLQYTHQFENQKGIFEEARLMPLARVRKVGEEDVTLGGSLILDLPKLGWIQGGYDSFYGAAAGVGFNLNERISLGYTMEKGLSNNFDNFGLTHEISVAYSFSPNLTEDRVMLEDDFEDDLVKNDEEPENVATNEEIEELKMKLAENDAIIEELMFRQDSLEAIRQSDLERRFAMVMRMVRNETNGERPDLEQRAKELFLDENSDTEIASSYNPSNTGQPINSNKAVNESQQDRVVVAANNTKEPVIKSEAVVATNTTDKSTVDRKYQKQVQPKDAVVASRRRTTTTTPTATTTEIVQDGVKSRRFKNLPDVTDGYYVVANVYKGGQYMNNFIDDLNAKGIQADYIDNPNTGLKYVYLQRFETFEDAVAAHDSKLNGAYDGAMWIMNVDNKYSNEAYASNVNKLKEKSSKYDSNVLTSNEVVRDNVDSREIDSKSYVIEGAGSGYYLIANVFANPNNAKKFVALLNSFGLSASYFINPKNNYRYVYLKKHDSWTNALISYYSKLNDAYDDKMWIMRVNQEQMA